MSQPDPSATPRCFLERPAPGRVDRPPEGVHRTVKAFCYIGEHAPQVSYRRTLCISLFPNRSVTETPEEVSCPRRESCSQYSAPALSFYGPPTAILIQARRCRRRLL